MGGTRFVGKSLLSKLLEKGFDITVFTRGHNPLPANVTHIAGDRNSDELQKLEGRKFDVIIDTSGRVAEQTEKVIQVVGVPSHRFIYLSYCILKVNILY